MYAHCTSTITAIFAERFARVLVDETAIRSRPVAHPSAV
jgi:hypothetical protein